MRILVVEDETRLAQLMSHALREESHTVDTCHDGSVAAEQAEQIPYDVIVLDWVLPGLDGLELLRRWRTRGVVVPVLLLSARGTVGEKVSALRAGADDYVVKPIDLSELCARVVALHRRGKGHENERVVAGLHFDLRARNISGAGGEQRLPAREFSLLLFLLDRLGDVVTRAELLASVWGPTFAGSPNVVDVYIGYVRARLAAVCEGSFSLETVRGIGYRLRALGATSVTTSDRRRA